MFSQEYWMLWALVLALALFFPVRNLLHVLLVRRAKAKAGDVDDAEMVRLKRRSGATAGPRLEPQLASGSALPRRHRWQRGR